MRKSICAVIIFAASGGFLSFSASAPALADNPCKSEDPLDADEAFRRADCGDSDKEGWGTYQTEREMNRIPDDGASGAGPTNYDHLPTTFTDWFDGLTTQDQLHLARRLAEEVGVDTSNYSPGQLAAIVSTIGEDLDSEFARRGMNAQERRRAIAEIAAEAGISVEPKAGFGADYYEKYGRPDAGAYEGWERVDPTDPGAEASDADGDLLDDF